MARNLFATGEQNEKPEKKEKKKRGRNLLANNPPPVPAAPVEPGKSPAQQQPVDQQPTTSEPKKNNPYVNALIETITGAADIQEAAQTIASGAAALPVSGWAGAATLSPALDAAGMGMSPDARKGIVEDVQQGMTIQPERPGAIAKLETLQDLVDMGIDMARVPLAKMGEVFELMTGQSEEDAAKVAESINTKGLSATYGDSVLDKTGDPLLATIAYAAPQIVPELLGYRVMPRPPTNLEIRVADKIKADSTPPAPVDGPPGAQPQIVEPVAPVEGVGRKILDGAMNAVDNKTFDAAVRQGWDQKYMALVQGSNPIEKTKYRNMLQIIENNRANPQTAIRDIHSNVLGESVLERYSYVKAKNKAAIKELDGVAEGLKGQYVDIKGPSKAFSEYLNDMDVDLRTNKEGKLVIDFDNSDLPPSSQTAIKRVLKKMERMTKEGIDAHSVHKLKRFIDEDIDFGKKSEGGLSRSANNALKELRHGIDTALDTKFDAYNQVNTVLHDTIGALDEFQGIAGKSLDLSKPSAKKTIGILMRRPTSNAKSGGQVMDAVDRLEAIARKYDGVFEDSLESQMLMVQEFERMLPRTAATTFKGDIVKAGVEVAKKSNAEKAAAATVKIVDTVQGINEANAIKTIKALLDE